MKFVSDRLPMLRFALTAYLSLTTVIGSALCCCTVESVLPKSKHSVCCGSKPGSLASAPSTVKPHTHKHGSGHGDHSHSPPGTASNEVQRNSPAEHNDKPCGCDQRHAKLVALVPEPTSHQAGSRDSGAGLFDLELFTLPIGLDHSLLHASALTELRPVPLFGREMLRAYQILRC